MEDFSLIIDILSDVLGTPKRHSHYKGQISFDCPVCSYQIKGLEGGDGKGNLEVNYLKNAYKCWSCYESHNTHGNLYGLVRRWGSKAQADRMLLLLPEEFIPQEKKETVMELPKEFIPFGAVPHYLKLTHYYKRANNYLKERGVTEEQVLRHSIGFCYEGPYGGRIIIPSYDKEGNLNYFTGRSYVGHKQKYKNPEAEKDKIFFNEMLLDFQQDIYLVEGPFDHLFVPNSIPMLGKYLSDMLWHRLYTEAQKNIFICLDGDAATEAERLYWKLNGGRLHHRVKVIKLPLDKDIADLRGKINEEWIIEYEHE